MYNRYIPQPDGSFQRNRMQEPNRREPNHRQVPSAASPPVAQQADHSKNTPHYPPAPISKQDSSIKGFLKNLLPKGLDTGDLLIIILLLLMAGDCAEEQNTAILTLVLYLFM